MTETEQEVAVQNQEAATSEITTETPITENPTPDSSADGPADASDTESLTSADTIDVASDAMEKLEEV